MVSLASDTDSIDAAFNSLPLPFDKTNTAREIEGSEEPGYSPVFRNNYNVSKGLISTVHPKLTTVYDYFEYAVKVYGDDNCVARRLFDEDGKLNDHYSYMSYKEVQIARNQFGSGILKIVKAFPTIESGNFILSLYSANRYEWVIADIASHAYSIPNVALYDTLGPESSTHILQVTKSPLIVLSKDKIQTVLDLLRDDHDLKTLKILVSMDSITDADNELVSAASAKGIKLYDFDQVVAFGKKFPFDVRPPKSNDLYTVSFTSGTVSLPKGCCLTHANAVAGVTFCWAHVYPPSRPRSLAFLPLAHVLERFKVLFELSRGGTVAFPHDPSKVVTFLDDIKVLEPTHLCAVPRLYNRIEAGIRDKVRSEPSWIKRKLIEWAIAYKIRAVVQQNDESLGCRIVNNLIINKIKEKIGFRNLDFLISGSAPLSEQTIIFLKAVLNCGFYQGYGLSESFAATAITVPKDPHPNSCGPIGITTEFRLRDLPEMSYSYAQNRSGELMFRGPQIFEKYFGDEKLTAEAKDKDGWFATGDVAKLTEQGNKIIIIDRAKNFFKLSQGEYVAAEKIENVYLSNVTFLNQLFLYGDSFQSFLVGILNVDPRIFVKFLNKYPQFENVKEVHEVDLDSVEIRKIVLKYCNDSIATSGLFGFEKFKNIKIGVDIFKVEDDVVTPTLKVKRPKAKAFFEKDIRKMYEEGVL